MTRFRKGFALEITGVIILLTGLILQQLVRERHKNIDAEDVGLLILAFGLLLGGAVIYKMGRQLRVRLAEEVFSPGEPYIMYLRSFASAGATSRVATNPGTPIIGLFGSTEEEKLARTLRVIARGIAVGKPGEKLPERGFHRIYIHEKDWLGEVETLMLGARLVLLRIGDTDGVRTEMKLAKEILQPERLVLLVPGESSLVRRAEELDSGLQLQPWGPHGARTELTLCPALTVPILRAAPGDPDHSFVGIVYFDSSWSPHVRPLRGIALCLTQSIDTAFKPVYRQLGIRKPIRLYEVISVLVAIGLLGLAGSLIYGSWQHHHPRF